ncbi:MAG: thermostable hemolysin [Pseudomonadales bacterium]|nr:thermostable hemolysin [Pseudomonadales bacterium]
MLSKIQLHSSSGEVPNPQFYNDQGRLQLATVGSVGGQSLNNGLVDIDGASALRPEAEQFVTKRFRAEYGATVEYFLGRHILSYDQGELKSVVGYHIADENPLYLEQYLSAPVEHVIASRRDANEFIDRASVVEVGNLASTSPGSFRRLVLSLCRYFYEGSASWVVFTSTPQLLNTFRKLGLELVFLGDAHEGDLARGAEAGAGSGEGRWGSYYEHKPTVVAGNIGYGLQQLLANPVLRKLLDRAPVPHKEGF